MENLIKKLEEQTTFLQHEVSHMSDELYTQQKEISLLKKIILSLEKKINDSENVSEANVLVEDKKPPHY